MKTCTSSRSDWLTAAAIVALLSMGSILLRISPVPSLPVLGLGGLVLLIIFGKAWRQCLPWGAAPWYRLVVVTVLLLGTLIALESSGIGSDLLPAEVLSSRAGRVVYFSLLALLAVPMALFLELFLRGYLYSLLENWRGSAVAVAGTAVVSVLIVAPAIQLEGGAVVSTLVAAFALAGSRWLTKSVVPALVAQGVIAAGAAAFLLVMAVS